MKDPFDRQIDYLRISITDRCNLRCTYCSATEPFHYLPHERILRLEEIVRLVEIAIQMGFDKIRITGGEPLLRQNLTWLVHTLSAMPGLVDLSLTTNGMLLAKMAAELKQAGLLRINISIDSLDPDRFRELTGGGELAAVMAGLEAAFKVGFQPIKINAVVHSHTPFEFPMFERMIREKPVAIRFIARMNLAHHDHYAKSGAWASALSEKLLAHGFTPDLATVGYGPAVYYRHPDYAGTFGIINHHDNHACERCNRLRLTADGRLMPCLFCGNAVPVFPLLREGAADAAIVDCLRQALAIKPKCGMLAGRPQERTMRKIGG